MEPSAPFFIFGIMILDKFYTEGGEVWVFADETYKLKKCYEYLDDLIFEEDFVAAQCENLQFNIKNCKIVSEINTNFIKLIDENLRRKMAYLLYKLL